MEPERRDTYTHIERDRRGGGMAFIVGGLVVAVAVIALVIWGGGWINGGVDAEMEAQDEAVVVTDAPDTPADVDVEVESQTVVPAAPAENTAPANEAAPAEPAAPVQQ